MATSMLPSKFEGDDIVEWLREFDACALANNWKDEEKSRNYQRFYEDMQKHTFTRSLLTKEKHMTRQQKSLKTLSVQQLRWKIIT